MLHRYKLLNNDENKVIKLNLQILPIHFLEFSIYMYLKWK
jgi:hypothetical protein